MATARDFRRIALSLEGTTEAPHFDRTAFKVRRIYATLAGDDRAANLMFTRGTSAQMPGHAGGVFADTQRMGGARRNHRKALGPHGAGTAQRAHHGVAARDI
jgi:hypothetical protein